MSNFREMAPEWISKKFQPFKTDEHVIYSFETRDSEISNICNYFREIIEFCDFMKALMISQNILLSIKSRDLFISRFHESNYIFEISISRASKLFIICSYFKSLKFYQTAIPEPFRENYS